MNANQCRWLVLLILLSGCSVDAPEGRMTAVADVQEPMATVVEAAAEVNRPTCAPFGGHTLTSGDPRAC